VLVSLLTDRLANADDEIPDGTGDRPGWWADMVLPLANAAPAGDLIGSRLWLLSRRKVTEPTRIDAIRYCIEALQWLLGDGIAAAADAKRPGIPTRSGPRHHYRNQSHRGRW
jgi:phage gp46-like protein